jgi:hypothetical protein
MSAPVVTTKLFIPASRPYAILRPRLVERLNQGLGSKLTLISAAAGSGKTTLVSSWVRGLHAQAESHGQAARRVAWLSLDKDDNDPARFLLHLVAALQTGSPELGAGQPELNRPEHGALSRVRSSQAWSSSMKNTAQGFWDRVASTSSRRISDMLPPEGLFISSTACLGERRTIVGTLVLLLTKRLSTLPDYFIVAKKLAR